MRANPAASPTRAISARVGPTRSGATCQLKSLIWRMSFMARCLPLVLLPARARRWRDGTGLEARQPPVALFGNKDQRRAIVPMDGVAFVLERVRLVACHDGGIRICAHRDL